MNRGPTLQEFVQEFRYQHWLLRHDPLVMKNHETYVRTIVKLRSSMVKELKFWRFPGKKRSLYHKVLDYHDYMDYRFYLFFKSDVCKLCSYPIYHVKYITEDHIIPRAKGGSNFNSNKQIAHGWCNVKKADHLIDTLKDLQALQ